MARQDSLSTRMAKITFEDRSGEDPSFEGAYIDNTVINDISHVSAIQMKHLGIYMGEGDPINIQVEQEVDGIVAKANTEEGDDTDMSTLTGVLTIKTPHFQIFMGQSEEVKFSQKLARQIDPEKDDFLRAVWMQRKSCVEVHKLLASMGVQHPEEASPCVKAAIQNGFIQVNGDPEELDKIIYTCEHPGCGHDIKASLRDCLNQPDCGLGVLDAATVACGRNNQLQTKASSPASATVACGRNNQLQTKAFSASCPGAGRVYITNLCSGFPVLDVSGEATNHCRHCPGFGACLLEFRNKHCPDCGDHFYAGTHGLLMCDNCEGFDDTSDSEGYLAFK